MRGARGGGQRGAQGAEVADAGRPWPAALAAPWARCPGRRRRRGDLQQLRQVLLQPPGGRRASASRRGGASLGRGHRLQRLGGVRPQRTAGRRMDQLQELGGELDVDQAAVDAASGPRSRTAAARAPSARACRARRRRCAPDRAARRSAASMRRRGLGAKPATLAQTTRARVRARYSQVSASPA